MISLAILYAALEAPFLFAVQIIVYTGAILMLFLFVLMLVGVDASDSVVETIRGQRLFAILGGLALGVTLVLGVGQISLGTVVGLEDANERRQHRGARQHPVLPLRLRLRGHLGAADHRRRGRDGARPPRAAHARSRPRPRLRPSGSARTPSPACTSARCRPPASSPGTTRSDTPALLPDGTRRRGLGLPGAGRPRHGPLGPARRRGGAALDRLRARRRRRVRGRPRRPLDQLQPRPGLQLRDPTPDGATDEGR